ncbi:hypothetical protein Bhyg_10169 [Pseudolycoriella hygida]|uniref:Uncharacterized protein n=1 Tax=Pseudolycoriella hygida TaxID=35572 RepID=A0A9Q0MTJ4_9DIPT|nr:hypothetical protein Bhyg_10169 [Pseudolycoriella hygida]
MITSVPNLTGPNILHTHSIKSWLEQQDFNNRGLSSPIEETYENNNKKMCNSAVNIIIAQPIL